MLLSDAPVIKRRWRCPLAGLDPDASRLDEACVAARAEVALVAGCAPDELGPTCPLYPTRLAWVRDVVRARKWAERGALEVYVGSAPAAQLIEAVDLLDDAVSARDARDAEESRRKADALRPPVRTE